MSDFLAITEEEARGLEAVARAELRLALSFAARAEAAEDPDAANGFARSAQRSARSYRQCLALKVRLQREVARQAREDRSDDRQEHQRAVAERKAAVKAAVRGVIWTTEREDEEAERLDDELDALLADDVLAEDFLDRPVAAQVARLTHDLGLAPAEADSPSSAETADPTTETEACPLHQPLFAALGDRSPSPASADAGEVADHPWRGSG